MSPTGDPSSRSARWATRTALLLAGGVVLVIPFVWRQLITSQSLAAVQLSPVLKWALAAGTAAVALVWVVAPPRFRAVAALVGGICGFAVTLVGIVLDPSAVTAAGYAVTLGTLSILLAGIIETSQRFDWTRPR